MGKSYGARHRRTETTGRGVTCRESGSLGALCHGFPLAVIPLSLILTIVGESGLVYSVGALILGLIFFYRSAGFVFRRSNVAARHLLTRSIVYPPTVLILVMLGKK